MWKQYKTDLPVSLDVAKEQRLELIRERREFMFASNLRPFYQIAIARTSRG